MSAAAFGSAGRLARHRRRKRVNAVALALSLAAMAFGLFWLLWILFETVLARHRRARPRTLFTADDAAAAGRDRRPRQRHLRLA